MMKGMEKWVCLCGEPMTGVVVSLAPADPEAGVGAWTDLLATTAKHPDGCCPIGKNGGRPRAELDRMALEVRAAHRADLLAARWAHVCPIVGLTLERAMEVAELVCRMAGQFLELSESRAHRTAKQFAYVATDLGDGLDLFRTAEECEAGLAAASSAGG